MKTINYSSCNTIEGDRSMEYLRMKIETREKMMNLQVFFGRINDNDSVGFMRSCMFFLLMLLGGTLSAAESDIQRVRFLSEQGLFAVAEAFCQEQFDRADLAEIDKVLLAAELVHSYAQQSLLSESIQRERIIKRLETLEIERLLRTAKPDSHELSIARIMLRLQLATAYKNLGDQQRLEADVDSVTNQQEAYRIARLTLYDTLKRLEECQKELQSFRQQQGIHFDHELDQKMQVLEYSIYIQQGMTQKSSALTLINESDRHAELRQAAELFSELAAKNSTDPIIVQCKIEKASCHRLCGEIEECLEILTPLISMLTTLTPECRLQTEAEWIRYHIAIGSIDEIREQYRAERNDSRIYPDFDLARLELFLASRPAPLHTGKDIRPESVATLRIQQTLTRQSGHYWERRAAMTVKILSAGNTALISPEILKALAEKAYQENRFAEAAEYYEQAASQADTNRQTNALFQYTQLAAGAWVKALTLPSEQSQEYRSRLIRLLRTWSMNQPLHGEAERFHLSAIDFQGENLSEQTESLQDYRTLIEEHLETWNESPHTQRLRSRFIVLLVEQDRGSEAEALLPLLNEEELKKLPAEIQRCRVRQLDADGKTQDAVDLLTELLKNKRDPATLQLFAEILMRQPDEKSLQYALNFWSELERTMPKGSEEWWAVREGIVETLCKLNRHEDAKKSFDLLGAMYPNFGGGSEGVERKKRFERQLMNNALITE